MPVGEASLMLFRLMHLDSIVPSDVANTSPAREQFKLRLDDNFLRCGGEAGAILVNFATKSGALCL